MYFGNIVEMFNTIENVVVMGNLVIVNGTNEEGCEFQEIFEYKHTEVAKEVARKVKMFIIRKEK